MTGVPSLGRVMRGLAGWILNSTNEVSLLSKAAPLLHSSPVLFLFSIVSAVLGVVRGGGGCQKT